MGSNGLSSMGIGNGSLSPSLTSSPPTPVLTTPHFLNTASTSFQGLNSILLQQYQQQQLQSQATFNAAAVAAAAAAVSAANAATPTTTSAESLPLLGHNWLSPLYP